MIKIENTEVFGWRGAIRGMRNALESWEQSDSELWHDPTCGSPEDCSACNGFGRNCTSCYVGEKDLELMHKLAHAGTDHGKFLRMIHIQADITCNHFWWAEFDTYKVGTVRNSCSKMHKIHVHKFVPDGFSHEGIDEVGGKTEKMFEEVFKHLEWLRKMFNTTHEKKYWRALLELLPSGYNIKATVDFNYQVGMAQHKGREFHKVFEWRDYCKWLETLPYFKEICLGDE